MLQGKHVCSTVSSSVVGSLYMRGARYSYVDRVLLTIYLVVKFRFRKNHAEFVLLTQDTTPVLFPKILFAQVAW